MPLLNLKDFIGIRKNFEKKYFISEGIGGVYIDSHIAKRASGVNR